MPKGNRLRKIGINELSLVDSPAGVKAHVALFKRDDNAGSNLIDEMLAEYEELLKAQPASTSVIGGGRKKNGKGPMLRLRGNRNVEDEDDDVEDDDDDEDEPLTDEELEKRRSIGGMIEARLHQYFTNMADELRASGKINRAERIAMSQAVGDALRAYVDGVSANAPAVYRRAPHEDAPDDPEQVSKGGRVPEPVGKGSTGQESNPSSDGPHPAKVTDQTEGNMPEPTLDLSTLPDDVRDSVQEYIDSLTKRAEDAETELSVLKAEDGGENIDDLLKSASPEVRSLVEKAQAEAAEATKIAKAEREARLHREFIAKAESLSFIPGETSQVATLMKSASEKLDDDQYQALETLLTSVNEQLSKSGIFKSHGSGQGDEAGGELEKLVKAKASEENISEAEAYDKVLQENPHLYDQAVTEGAN